MSELESAYVHRGAWTDLNKGIVMGKTITTDTRTGAFVVALLAIISGLATAHLWHLATFTIHQIRADGMPKHPLFRQQQAMLRTLPSPGSLIADLIKLIWTWGPNHKAPYALTHTLVLIILATVFVGVSWAASIFSNYVVDTANLSVLVSSPNCGAVNLTFDTYGNIGRDYLTEIVKVAEPFAEDCYMNKNASLPARCEALIYPKSLFTHEKVACPWDSIMCVGDNNTPALRVDSGLIDLNSFGLNLPEKDRVQMRKQTTCSVLTLENRTQVINATDFSELNRDPMPQEELMMFFYGDWIHSDVWKNATFDQSLSASNTTTVFNLVVQSAAGTPEWKDYGSFVPLPEMQRDDADLMLKFVAKNYVMYREPVNDPLFSAHKSRKTIDNIGINITRYYSDSPVSVVGCAQQYQYCVAQPKGQPYCTGLTALPANPTKENFPKANDVQLAALQVLVTSEAIYDIGTSKTFDASKENWAGEITGLPDDQWETEVVRWEAIAWAGLQSLITDYSIGPKHRDSNADAYVITPTSQGEKQLCRSQKMQKSGDFVNINVFGLTFIITFACIIITLDIFLLKFLVFISRFQRAAHLSQRIERWIQDGVLQLQRRAYEAQGQGNWIDIEKDIPMTTDKDALRDLKLESMPLTMNALKMFAEKMEMDAGRKEKEFTLKSSKTWATDATGDTAIGYDSASK